MRISYWVFTFSYSNVPIEKSFPAAMLLQFNYYFIVSSHSDAPLKKFPSHALQFNDYFIVFFAFILYVLRSALSSMVSSMQNPRLSSLFPEKDAGRKKNAVMLCPISNDPNPLAGHHPSLCITPEGTPSPLVITH